MMERKLVEKMITNCFKQYYEGDTAPISERDLERLAERIYLLKKEDPKADLFEVVNDAVYEFLTD